MRPTVSVRCPTTPGMVVWVQATDAEVQAILTATQELCSEPHLLAFRVPASVIAEKAGTDPRLTVSVLFKLDQTGRVTFDRAGAGDPETSCVRCPGKNT